MLTVSKIRAEKFIAKSYKLTDAQASVPDGICQRR